MQTTYLIQEFTTWREERMDNISEKYTFSFYELSPDNKELAGGKGKNLALLHQKGYPVPDGFIIVPEAFNGDELKAEAWEQVKFRLEQLSRNNGNVTFAVRSSALSEDSAQASFAGEFETVLDVKTDEAVRKAIITVHQSRSSKRVQVYSEIKGMDNVHQIAIVIQRFVKADIAGVLFTADPVSGNRMVVTGNYVHGTGDVLVSGESNASEFSFQKLKNMYSGSNEFESHAKSLYKLSMKLEEQFGWPQDIEFAIAGKKVYLLQTRPITTLTGHDPLRGEWNYSFLGDFVWTNVNASEACPNVMTPSTWSIFQKLYEDATPLKKIYKTIPSAGNIGGRLYFNLTLSYSIFRMTMAHEEALYLVEEVFGRVPEELLASLKNPFSKLDLLRLLPSSLRVQLKLRKLEKNLPHFISAVPEKARKIRQQIAGVEEPSELITTWKRNLQPFLYECFWMMLVIVNVSPRKFFRIKAELTEIADVTDVSALLLHSGKELASIGPLLGLSKVINQEISREDYFEKYGHRGEDEFELSVPRPEEIPKWMDLQLNELGKHQFDIESMLNKQESEFKEALDRLKNKVEPKILTKIKKRMQEASSIVKNRETVRSEYARAFGLLRIFFLRAAEFLEINGDVFFLTVDELLNTLAGNNEAVSYITTRKEANVRYKELPPYPVLIHGQFDPFQWTQNPDRRTSYYSSHAISVPDSSSDMITGFAGAKGIVEGVVRRLNSPEEGDQLQIGEILVAKTTNIGWTILFPRAAAIITDIGAPFSHAAIIARELGIPAVVGCGDATVKLQTGDKVIVDGGQGMVKIVNTTHNK
jgi:pyruvate,water dikinase